ncbi:uncharacterized protein LOC122307433 [Carya illinoinensis]|uniref:uncharacterized protein LOC122276937 n=1 Tax=Carya illinoinensis TaxID=32201 RepID=UPI001C71806B|nr:uncharacterized protein LOC122276937 [Carya illinoinensis]XP_042976260.1 uncharacterized protein LOC122307433 [Carya illinoinensis]
MDKSWMNLPNRLRSPAYAEGVNTFLNLARNHSRGSDRIRCPCRACCNTLFLPIFDVETHLFMKGINPNYTQWIFHGEEETQSFNDDDDDSVADSSNEYIDDMDHMLDDIRAGTFVDHAQDHNNPLPTAASIPDPFPSSSFEQLLEDARRPLFPGCTKFSKLSFIVKLLHIKTLGGWSIKSFDMLLNLLRTAFPDAELPHSYEESRWVPNTHKARPIPQKVLRHFPLKPRLQRLFMTANIARDMRWHKEQRPTDDGESMRHPADAESWKRFDEDYSWFAQDARNVRLGLASDGFNPFNNMAKPYSIWPVILVPYNLPPWLCMKDQFFMTSLIIPGPKSAGNDIDVYLQPLVDELLEFWEQGVPTYDASTKETFMLHAALMWTINDFPAYGILSGWSTKGRLACPACNEGTDANWLKYGRKHCYMGHRRFLPPDHMWRKRKNDFNGKEDHRMPPRVLEGSDIEAQLLMLGDVQFGKSHRKRKRTVEELNWTKYSIFFRLPYWVTLRLRHNLDVMHIEKNIFDNILSTLMNIPGKTKDNINSRRDLEIFGFRKELHLKYDGERVTMPHSMYTLHGEERKKFCEWLADVKFPDGFASNISHCVSVRDCRISGLKSHDCHVFMQRLLPIAVGGFLRPDIGLALTELCTFFKGLCARTLDVNQISQFQTDIATILCKLEMIFPPSFFDVMVHLAVHLPREAILDVETKFTRVDRNIDGEAESIDGFKIFNQKVRPIGTASNRQLSDKLLTEATWYVLNNCAEIGPYLEEHYEKCRVHNPNSIDRTHHTEFPTWLKKRVQDQRITNPLDVVDDLYALVCGPERWVASYTACIINGKRFHTKQRELRRRTQNSGVLVTGDENTNNVDFYGVINEIVELHYMGWRRVYLFMCDWFDVGDPRRGVRVDNHMTSINMDRIWYKDEPFVLACQASQCFYIKDIRAKGRWFVVQKYTNRNVYDIPSVPRVLEDLDGSTSDDDAYQETEESYDYAPLQCDACPVTTPLNRDDLEPILIEAQDVTSSVGQKVGSEDFIDDDMIDSGSGDASGDGEYSDEEDFSTDDESLSA